MTFNPLDFLTLAQTTVSDKEAEIRTAISRAYYGLFLKARDHLSAAGYLVPSGSGDDHGAVIFALRSHRRVLAGDRFHRLRDLRTIADYDTSASVQAAHLERTLNLARDIQRLLAPDWGITT